MPAWNNSLRTVPRGSDGSATALNRLPPRLRPALCAGAPGRAAGSPSRPLFRAPVAVTAQNDGRFPKSPPWDAKMTVILPHHGRETPKRPSFCEITAVTCRHDARFAKSRPWDAKATVVLPHHGRDLVKKPSFSAKTSNSLAFHAISSGSPLPTPNS